MFRGSGDDERVLTLRLVSLSSIFLSIVAGDYLCFIRFSGEGLGSIDDDSPESAPWECCRLDCGECFGWCMVVGGERHCTWWSVGDVFAIDHYFG